MKKRKALRTIEWLSRSKELYDVYLGIENSDLRGAYYYEILAINMINELIPVVINPNYIRSENDMIRYYLKNHTATLKHRVNVLDRTTIQAGKFDPQRYNIGIIHHLDLKMYSRSPFHRFALGRLLRNLKKMNQVIVVSQFWKDFLCQNGIKKVKLIYNSFEPKEYVFSEKEKAKFRTRHNIFSDKPLVYLGPNRKGKGLNSIVQQIDFTKFQAVATGRQKLSNPHVKSLFLTHRDYRLLLASCDITLCMSQILEGWNRVAHESLLAKTPVIGLAGTGGMEELLHGAGQIMLNGFDDLNFHIGEGLQNASKYTEAGHKFASKFNHSYFKNEWLTLVDEACNHFE